MSGIYFHAPHGEARVRGSERAMAQVHSQELFRSLLPLTGDRLFEHEMVAWKAVTRPEDHDRLFEPGDPLPAFREQPPIPMWRHRLGLYLGSSFTPTDVLVDGKWESSDEMAMNTAHRWGGDAVKLLVRLHCQCEIHAFVEGRHRAWLARIIRRGRRDHVLRADMGWEAVADLLLSRDDEPVVTSYSVTDQFPSLAMAVRGGYRGGERFHDLSDARRWDHAMAGLRARGDAGWLALRPGRVNGGWSGFFLGRGKDASDLHAAVWPLIEVGQAARDRERAAAGIQSATP